VANPGSTIPLVGASGAIAGVLGAYFLLFPRHRISTLVVFFVFLIRVIRIPAFFFLGFWFLFQVLLSSMGGSVAWWAHIGGFVAGLLLAGFFLQPRKQGR
jgi:membrane associated rhomboid family serine protease